jgi:hypothetical protein
MNAFWLSLILIVVGAGCLLVLSNNRARGVYLKTRPKFARKGQFATLDLALLGVGGFLLILFGLAGLLSYTISN